MFAAADYADLVHFDLKLPNATLETVFREIEKNSEFSIVYRTRDVDLTEKVSVDVKNQTVNVILDQILKGQGLQYEIKGKHIILFKPEPVQLRQGKRVTGTVKDAYGEPVSGATIREKGADNGDITDADGNFAITVAENATLIVSYIGYKTLEISVLDGGGKPLVITLLEDTQALEEVVVIGYGTQRKGEVASAITTVRAENFIKYPSPDAAKMIRGQVAGLAVNTPDANPTSSSQLMLRGITTLRSSTSPLILVDGIPSDLMTVSPDDIAQIDVLKDGSAAAIYGTRGTNGVIIITTKNAKGEMPTTVEVNAYLSTQQITRKLPMMNAEQYREKVAQGKPGAIDGGSNVNWLDEILQTPLTQVYNINLMGGSKSTNYVASLDYRSMEGIIKRSDNRTLFPRIEITHRMFDNKLRINAGVNGYLRNYYGATGGVYQQGLKNNPTDPIRDESGAWRESPTNGLSNPLAMLYETESDNEATNLRLFSNISLTPIEGLDINWMVSSNRYTLLTGYYETQQNVSTTKSGLNGYASRGTSHTENDVSELTASYRKTLWKDHSFTILGGYSWLRTIWESFSMSNFNFPSDDYTYNNIGAGGALSIGRAGESSSKGESKLISYFSRLNYAYKEKYMLAASVRYEGSTKFGANHKWGTFPAASVAWNIKKEDFLKDNSSLSTLKLRIGFGVTGTEPSDAYMSLNSLSFGTYDLANGEWVKTIRPSSNPNPNLRWERKEETNIGLDFGFANDRLTGSIDLYNRDTKDLIWSYNVPSPPYLYSSMMANGGSIRNRGVEIAIQAIPIETKDIRWVTNANFSTNKNKLISLSNEQFITGNYSDQGYVSAPVQTPSHRMYEGGPIGDFWGFKSIDIDDNGHWIIEGEDGNPKPVAQAQPTDKKVIGNGSPKYFLNWNNSLSYKNFDLGITMRGAFGFQIINMSELFYAVPNNITMSNLFERAYDPVYGKRPLADDQPVDYVSYFVEDGDYWKIDNVTLGYTLKVNSKWIKQARIYGIVSNMLIFTGYKGIDPEVNISGLSPGIDSESRYPAARTFTLGASLKF
jgi:TonB-linked SusC/RagA family outer membrane protein